MKKKILVISSSRGDFDLLSNLLIELKCNNKFELCFVISGSLTDNKFGNLTNYINKKVKINERIKLNFSQDNSNAINENISSSIVRFNQILNKKKPSIVLVLGDRYELFSLVIPTFIKNIPIAHIHGGEITEGAQDNAFRDSISKMSQIHFVSNLEAKKRLNKMGINKNIYVSGGLGAFNTKVFTKLTKNQIEKKINFNFKKINFLITFNPVTLEKNSGILGLKNLLKVLKSYKNTGFIFTMPNADFNFTKFNLLLQNFCEKNKNAKLFKFLGKDLYFSIIKCVDAVIGNSSSGLLEVPSFKKPVINIGSRQTGRVKYSGVIDSNYSLNNIKDSINKSLKKSFKKKIMKFNNPYYRRNTTKIIIKVLKKF